MNCKVITNGRVCCEGDLEVLLSNTTNLQNAGRWSIVFFTGGLTCSIPEKYVIASYDGTTYSNCRRVDNGNILCYFRGPKLGSGQLCYKLYLGIADSDFSPNFRDDVYPVATNYELGPWPTDSVRAELDLLVLSGIINAQIVGATAETLPAGSPATVTLGGTATERTFAFGIPAGHDGAAGEAAQITSATASVDNTTGTPSVNIELGGTPEKRTFDFKFSGLKGEPDDSSVRYDEAQDLTDAQKQQARTNIGVQYVVESYDDVIDTLANSDCTLDERVETLEKALIDVLSGAVLIPKLQVKELNVWGDNNIAYVGDGAPTKAPDRAGQFYIDKTARALYFSTGNAAVSDWKIK